MSKFPSFVAAVLMTASAVLASPAPAFAGQVNAYVTLGASTDFVGESIEDRTRNKGSWSASGGAATSSARFSVAGNADAQTSAPGVRGKSVDARASIWGGDALVVAVPGASADQITTLQFKVVGRGTSMPNAVAGLDVCFGSLGSCGNVDAGLDELKLPQPVGVEVGAFAYYGGTQNESWDVAQTLNVTIRGAEAVVPFWYHLYSGAGSNGVSAGGSGKLVRLDIQLPVGVTCTSRSGKAFKGRCPAAQ